MNEILEYIKNRAARVVTMACDYMENNMVLSEAELKEILEDAAKEFAAGTNVGIKWIPCSERLPDIGNRCLVTLSNNVVAIGTLHNEDNKRWHLEPTSMMIAYYEDSVTAWIPLPMPYRKDGE